MQTKWIAKSESRLAAAYVAVVACNSAKSMATCNQLSVHSSLKNSTGSQNSLCDVFIFV
jgi:hypothetical protein